MKIPGIDKRPSISSFIASRLLILFAAFVLCYSFLVNHVYLWGIDEATSFYMEAEAEIVLQSYRTGEPIADSITGFREYYWPGQLPQKYRQMFVEHDTALNHLLLSQGDGLAIYMLPFGDSTVELYAVHILPDVTASDETSTSIRKLLLQVAITTLIALILMSAWVVYRLVNATMVLSRWAARLSSEDPQTQTLPETGLRFKEMYFLAQRLAGSFARVAEVNQKEQIFLRSLSHELRTPIAVTTAALDVLDKKVSEPATTKLTARIRRASNSMRSLTETILWLWREPEDDGQKHQTPLLPVIEQALADNQYLLKGKEIEVDNKVEPALVLNVDKTLLTIVCNNLVRNAFQYCDEGRVCLLADDRGLAIGNSYTEQSESQSQGFGLGLLIVQRIADNYGWQLVFEAKDGQFELAIRF